MRIAVVFLTALVVLTGVFCGKKSSPAAAAQQPAAMVEKFPAVACSTLTEAELTQFVKALPAFKAALKAASWSPAQLQQEGGPLSALTTLVEGVNVPSVAESLKAAGTDWPTFRGTLYKVFSASAALNIATFPPENAEQMRKDTSQAGKTAYRSFEAMKQACTVIPPGNMEVVKAHQQELQPLGSLGQ